jgi:hypothetical protein
VIAAWILGYVACSVASPYFIGSLPVTSDADRRARAGVAAALMWLGPIGLVIALALAAYFAGVRRDDARQRGDAP